MGDSTELMISPAGTTNVATDEMWADVERLVSISAQLDIVRIQLAMADSMLTYHSRSMSQVRYALDWMDEARVAGEKARSNADYVSGQLVIAIEQYSETERNTEAMVTGLWGVFNFGTGRVIGTLIGPGGEAVSWLVRLLSGAGGESVAPLDAEFPDMVNRTFSDAEAVERLRRWVMTSDSFALGLGGSGALFASWAALNGYSGPAIPAQLMRIYGGMAGMLTETGVIVRKTDTIEHVRPITSTEDRLRAIPDPMLRGDGAQVRIDEIRDGDEVRYEVFVAGTQDFNPVAGSEAFDMTSNVTAVAGGSPASYEAVLMAMASIPPGAEVSLVGYSQGALIATMVAASGTHNVVGLTTIGSPAGQIVTPPSVTALVIEHLEDPVIALGGTQANHNATVVQRSAFSPNHPANLDLMLPAHHLEYYLDTAAEIDRADSRKLQQAVDTLNEFSAGDSVTSTYYRAERVP